METNLVILEKKAIDAALKNDWTKALEYNTLILKKNPKDISAQIRLGKAQIHNKEFQDAVKTFKKVLSVDPINQIALKNLQIAKDGKILTTTIHPKKLIKEPGTTTETVIFANRRLHLEVGQILELNIKKAQVDILKEKSLVGTIEDKDIVKSLNQAKTQEINTKLSGHDAQTQLDYMALAQGKPKVYN